MSDRPTRNAIKKVCDELSCAIDGVVGRAFAEIVGEQTTFGSNATAGDSPPLSYRRLLAVMDSIGKNPCATYETVGGSGFPVIICHDKEDAMKLVDALGAKTKAMSGADRYRWGIPIKIGTYVHQRADGGIDVVRVAKGEYDLMRVNQ